MPKLKEYLLSGLIMLGVVCCVWYTASFAFVKSLDRGNNLDYLMFKIDRCSPFQSRTSSDRVILRLDDVQATQFSHTTIKMVHDAFRRKMHMVLAVIPYELSSDIKIDRMLKQSSCNTEIALHGWDHGIPDPKAVPFEFEALSEAQAKIRIEKGIAVLKQYTPNIYSFIPPGNDISDGSLKALADLGIPNVTGSQDTVNYRMTATYDFDHSKSISVSENIADCKKAFADGKVCVIIIHPQDYQTNGVLDATKYKNYISLLDTLNSLNVQTITFRDIPSLNKPVITR